jgi:hypothetical protein
MSEPELQAWIAKHPDGTPVRYRPIRGKDEFIETEIDGEPWRLGHGQPVVRLKHSVGGVALWSIERIKP